MSFAQDLPRPTLSPADFADSPLSEAFRQPLMLGVFLNLQDIQRSSLESSSTWTFDYNAAIVRRADELGFELAFSRTQWLPKGGYDGDPNIKQGRGFGGNLEIVGTPEQVVEQMLALKAVGIDGLQASFFDFAPDLEFFGSGILPLMKQAGLRN